jgi:hypothetical protein
MARRRITSRDHRGPSAPEPAAAKPDLDDDYAGLVGRLKAHQFADLAVLAAEYGMGLRRKAEAMPRETLTQKRALARWVNHELRQFGLAIRCPRTGRPSALLADPGRDIKSGRFQLYNEAPGGKMERTLSSATLPALDLIPAETAGQARPEGRQPRGGAAGKPGLDASVYAVGRTVLGPAAEDYGAVAGKLSDAHRGFRRAVAEVLEPALNAQAGATPHDTYDGKREVARWVNEELRGHGLAVKCPKTGQPALLVADPGQDGGRGRFQFDILTAAGRRKRTLSSVELPRLELIDAITRRRSGRNKADSGGE